MASRARVASDGDHGAEAGPLVAIGTLGLVHVNWSNFAPTVPPINRRCFRRSSAATALTLFSYLGIESATVPADDVEIRPNDSSRHRVRDAGRRRGVHLQTSACWAPYRRPRWPPRRAYADAAAAIWGAGPPLCHHRRDHLRLWRAERLHPASGPGADGRRARPTLPGALRAVVQSRVPAFGCVVSSILATAVLLSYYGGRGGGAAGLADVYNGIILLATFTTLVPYAFCAMAELLAHAAETRARPRQSRPASGWAVTAIDRHPGLRLLLLLHHRRGSRDGLARLHGLLLGLRSTSGFSATSPRPRPRPHDRRDHSL